MLATPEQLQEMFSYCMDFARTMLEQAGDFYPFGATLSPDGVVAAVVETMEWPALTRCCDNGAIEIDNSAVERALRGIAIGRPPSTS